MDSSIEKKNFKYYLSVILLFFPAVFFGGLLLIFRHDPHLEFGASFSYFPWQFYAIGVFGTIATIGGVLDWRFHRVVLKMRLPKKEREAEAAALGLGGLPMAVLMFFAMLSDSPNNYLIPILVLLIYTVVAISYDEFVFHKKRCGKLENTYHRMLVFGNGLAWLAWFHFIYG